MASRLTADDVRHVARLAHLSLTDDEVTQFTDQLQRILEYASDVQAIDTTGVAPTSHALVDDTKWRDDVATPSLDRESVLRGAPEAAHALGLFRVPKVL